MSEEIEATIKWEEDSNLIHRLFINDAYVGKLHFTVDGDTVVDCQFVRSSDHKRISINMTRLMLQAAKYEVLAMVFTSGKNTADQTAKVGKN